MSCRRDFEERFEDLTTALLVGSNPMDAVFLEPKPADSLIVDENGYTVGTRAEAFEKARAAGLEVLVPKPNQLFIDIDDEASYQVLQAHADILDKYIGVTKREATISKSGGVRRHVTLTLSRDITATERVGLQAMLGSDRKRELLSFIRVLQGDEDPTVFFEKPQQVTADVVEEDIPF